jgi:Cu2+-containing amine oxidase
MVKGKAVSIRAFKNIIFVKMDNKKIIKSHIVVNVSGPVNLDQLNSESNLINSIKSNINKFDKRGFITDKNFMLTEQIYAPGILSYNFNPSRQTIIKAITNNSHKIIRVILKK